MPATIRDVAKRAEVSISTVSRVINNENNVKDATVARVRKAIDECNYIPNAVAQNLKTDSTKIIGFVVSDISNGFYMIMAKVIESILHEKGYAVILCGTDDDPQKERSLIMRLQSMRVDGFIINTTENNNELISNISRTKPVVLVERSTDDLGFEGSYVGSDNHQGIKLLTEYLISNNHRKIGFINCNRFSTGKNRFAGFKHTMEAAGLSVDGNYPYIYNSPFFFAEEGWKACNNLMSLPEPPTALLVANNTLGIGTLKYLNSHGFSVPDDVSVAVLGSIDNSDLFAVNLTYINQNPYAIGEKAVKSIIDKIESPLTRGRDVIFGSTLIEGKSVKFAE